MTVVRDVTVRELEQRREALLRDVRMSDAEIREKAERGGLTGTEWSLWATLEEIDFLLGRDD